MAGDLDTAYAIAPFIPGAESYPAAWASRAAAFRTAMGARAHCGLPYGAGSRQRLDLFLPEGAPRGLMVFVHGGFWRAFGRQDWSHLAGGAVARGWAAAVAGYTLAPDARIRDITVEIAEAVRLASAEVPAGPLVVMGHSAGGHLAARMLCPDLDGRLGAVTDRLARAVPISPLGDLRPLTGLAMNADWQLDTEEATAESPALGQPRQGVEAHVWVGAEERPAFLEQARNLAAAWDAPLTIAAGRHHFDVIDEMTQPRSALMSVALDGLGV
ncbi:MAG: alpha/beta hydrolase [Alkalilacustris sp.]